MNREVHVQFRGNAGVKFTCVTRLPAILTRHSTVTKGQLTIGLFLIMFMTIFSCKTKPNDDYKLISYLDIKVDSLGKMPRDPYILTFKKGSKELLVIGTMHSRDTLNPMFDSIERLFYEFNPEVIINEGGNLHKTYPNRNFAIAMDAELGLEKYLADKVGIKTINGDEPFGNEFYELSQTYSKEEAILFFGSERFVFPFAFGQYRGEIDSNYVNNFIEKEYVKNNIALTDNEKTFDYYKKLYKKYFQTEFTIDTINQQDFAPFSRRHHFCDVTRKSKEFRDRYLLTQIETQLQTHNKVMVVYGGWHILAIEQALKQIIDRQK